MSDFAKFLRTADGLRCPTERELEAAARIEALEAALREIEDCLDYVKDKGVVWKIARAALDKDTNE
jgi:N-glycosylase/DNA lyase